MVFIILIFNGLLAQLFSFLIDLSAKLTRVDLCCLRNLFLLELFLVGAGLDMGAVNENCAGVQHSVVQCFVENMLKYLTGQLIREALAEGIAHRRKVGDIIQQSIPKKPTVSIIHLNFPVSLPQRRYPKQMLNEYHLDQHNRICAGTAIVMAVVRVQPFIQPLIIHDLFYFPQQMLLWHQRPQIYDDWLMPCVFSPAFHVNTPVSSIIAEAGAFA